MSLYIFYSSEAIHAWALATYNACTGYELCHRGPLLLVQRLLAYSTSVRHLAFVISGIFSLMSPRTPGYHQ